MNADWDARVDAVWAAAADLGEAEVLRRIDELVAERGETDARAAFEAASARDYVGQEVEAAPLYRRALEVGLAEPHKSYAIIQLASTLRNLGEASEAIRMLEESGITHPAHPQSSAANAFLALAHVTDGDPQKGAAIALHALAGTMTEYSRAIHAYADELTSTDSAG